MGKENMVYGRGVVREILRSNINIDVLYIDRKINKESLEDILSSVGEKNIDVKFLCKNDIFNICKNDSNQGIVAKISGYKYLKFNECLNELEKCKFPFVLILDSIQDPRNLGAILRSAECIGIKNVIIPQKRSVGITDVVWKTSMGAVAHLNICRSNNLLNLIKVLKSRSFRIIATDVGCSSLDLRDGNYDFPIALVVGSEHDGISSGILKECDIRIRIPMFGNIGSFNVSVATAITMYEIRNRQRGN